MSSSRSDSLENGLITVNLHVSVVQNNRKLMVHDNLTKLLLRIDGENIGFVNSLLKLNTTEI
jgi:hypothetical protein